MDTKQIQDDIDYFESEIAVAYETYGDPETCIAVMQRAVARLREALAATQPPAAGMRRVYVNVYKHDAYPYDSMDDATKYRGDACLAVVVADVPTQTVPVVRGQVL